MTRIRFAKQDDEPFWRELWKAYCEFYEAQIAEDVTQTTWKRLLDPASSMACLLAVEGDEIVGFANYVVHPFTWSARPTCYLEDLFVRPEARGRGAGRVLVEAIVARAREEGWARVYWHTRHDNAAARALYDSFAGADDFVRYVVTTDVPRSDGAP
jgi:GNAT superfamily N-acetyltransferase